MSYIRNIIDENGKRNIQCVNENEHSRAQNRTPQKNNQETKLRKEKNLTIEEHSVKTQHRDQLKRLLWHRPINSTKDFSESLKDRQLRSIHTVHIKHPRIKFQIFESCFPSQ